MESSVGPGPVGVKGRPQTFPIRYGTAWHGMGQEALAAVRDFLGFSGWPGQIVRPDLGGRELEVTGCPGHHPASIAGYVPWSGFLVTGGTVYPGCLYTPDFPEFTASLKRLVGSCQGPPGHARAGLSHRDEPHAGPRLPARLPVPAR